MPALQVLLQRRRGMQVHAAAPGHARHQQVLLVRHARILVVHHLAVAIKGQAIFHVAPHPEHRNRLIRRRQQLQPIGQRPRRVRPVEQVNHPLCRGNCRNPEKRSRPIQEKHQHHQHPAGGQT